jgi:glycosyltransferase involved in cell wall biosynthesis
VADILVFYQYYCTPNGAWGTRWYELARRWVAAGHRVTVVTSIYDKSDLEASGLVTHLEIAGARIIALNIGLSNRHGLARRLASFLAFACVSSYFALREPADIVVASSGPLSVALPGLVARWIRRVPLVFEVRDVLPDTAVALGALRGPAAALARLVARAAYGSARTVVALSPDQAARIRRVAPRAAVDVIPNAADLDLFKPRLPVPTVVAEHAAGKFGILYAGTLGRVNAGYEILDLALELRRRGADDVVIWVLGDGSEIEGLRARQVAERLDNVVFLGLRPKTEVAAWHVVARLTLLTVEPRPALWACSPNKLFDSLAAGRPVLQNTQGWIRALLEESDAGVTYPARDVAAAADAVLALRDDPSRLAAMSARARQLAEARFDRDALAARFLEIVIA